MVKEDLQFVPLFLTFSEQKKLSKSPFTQWHNIRIIICVSTSTVECHTLEEIKLNDSQYSASSIYSHDTNDEYVKKEYGPANAKLNNQINGGKTFIFDTEGQFFGVYKDQIFQTIMV